ncbi:MAG: hypothetical protein VX254_06205, partial [Planctomycetota bacterium]|nr:hypothetical protein [Planctomycetota bacterium]
GVIRDVTEVGISLLALGVVAGILFGTDAANLAFVGPVVDNVIALVTKLGGAGLTGLLSLAVILYLFKR